MEYSAAMTGPAKRMFGIISGSFIDLLETNGFDKISKTDICEKAGISSSTFYRYFSDKYDLASSIFNSHMNKYLDFMKESFSTDIQKCFHDIYKYTMSNKKSLRALLNIQNPELDFEYVVFKKLLGFASSLVNENEANALSQQFLAGILNTFFLILFKDASFDNVKESDVAKILSDSFIQAFSTIFGNYAVVKKTDA